MHRLLLIWNIIYCHYLSWSKILKMFVIALNLIWWIILWSILITEKGTQHVQFVTYNSIVETVSKVAWSNPFICQHDVLNHEENELAKDTQWSAIQLTLQFHFENNSLLALSYFVWQTLIAHLICTLSQFSPEPFSIIYNSLNMQIPWLHLEG